MLTIIGPVHLLLLLLLTMMMMTWMIKV